MSLLYRTPPDLCGSYRHRPIGRPWHASPLTNSSLAEAISWSTRNMLPLPHSKPIRSHLPLTIHSWCLCLATLKPSLILGFQTPPAAWATVLQRVDQGAYTGRFLSRLLPFTLAHATGRLAFAPL